MVGTRRRNAAYLTKHLSEIKGVIPPSEAPYARHAYYYYALRIDTKTLSVTREQFEKALTAEGIPISPSRATTLVNRCQLFAKKLGYGGTNYPWSLRSEPIDYGAQRLPVAEAVERETFWLTDALPVLSRNDLDDMVAAVEKVASIFLDRARSAA
jgi:dTDP-4-amino-4,6-dideoxygalactose transaminase